MLRAALEDTMSSHGRLVILVGEPGIGKTRTAQALVPHTVVLSDVPTPSYEQALSDCAEDLGSGQHPLSIEVCRQSLSEHLELVPTLRPFRAFAMGTAADDRGPYLTLVLIHDDEGMAEENVSLLHRRLESGNVHLWSEFVTDSSHIEINARGRILSARIRG